MNIDMYWLLALAVALSALGVALAWQLRRRRRQRAVEREQKTEVKSWENEGGNLATTPATSIPP